MEPTYQLLVDRIIHKWSEKPHDRTLIALAEPPGSGKTTVAQEVARRLASSRPATLAAPKTAVVSIDGFHLTLAALRALPNAEEALARRGAPWAFDADAAVALVRELRTSGPSSSEDSSRDVVVPTFDHAVKDPVTDGLVVEATCRSAYWRAITSCLTNGCGLLSPMLWITGGLSRLILLWRGQGLQRGIWRRASSLPWKWLSRGLTITTSAMENT